MIGRAARQTKEKKRANWAIKGGGRKTSCKALASSSSSSIYDSS